MYMSLGGAGHDNSQPETADDLQLVIAFLDK
jgi:hypothetical protein